MFLFHMKSKYRLQKRPAGAAVESTQTPDGSFPWQRIQLVSLSHCSLLSSCGGRVCFCKIMPKFEVPVAATLWYNLIWGKKRLDFRKNQ